MATGNWNINAGNERVNEISINYLDIFTLFFIFLKIYTNWIIYLMSG